MAGSVIHEDKFNATDAPGMSKSLNAALKHFAGIERLIKTVQDPLAYKPISEAFSFTENQDKNGVPYDEARQAFTSHRTRLDNMTKVRMGADESDIIDARKEAISTAAKLYAERQTKALEVLAQYERNPRDREEMEAAAEKQHDV